jgi:hypothetical protein
MDLGGDRRQVSDERGAVATATLTLCNIAMVVAGGELNVLNKTERFSPFPPKLTRKSGHWRNGHLAWRATFATKCNVFGVFHGAPAAETGSKNAENVSFRCKRCTQRWFLAVAASLRALGIEHF